MYKLKDFVCVLDEIAPLSLSYKMIEKGDYDNSGLIVESGDTTKTVLFSLDLSLESVKKAIELGADTIVTHHPAIYNPVKTLSINGQTKPLVLAIKHGISVISMHLNLDLANGGIDQCLCEGLGGRDCKILDYLDDDHGYGRQATIEKSTPQTFVECVKKTFGTDKILFYGDKTVNKIASFCGGGDSHALIAVEKSITDADTIITSDVPHHVLKELIELGKNVMILPHYVSEQYGFYKFYQTLTQKVDGKVKTYYFEDKRFM